MYISSIKLKDFRNIEETTINFHPHYNFFIGRNAQGKTNILEAVYLIGRNLSFRTSGMHEIINWNKEEASIEAKIDNNEKEVIFQKTIKKELGVPSKKEKKPIKWSATVFSADDIFIVKGSPLLRRRWLDSICCELYPAYSALLSSYARIVDQRNNLLFNCADEDSIHAWTERMMKIGTEIIIKRLEAIEKINPKFNAIHKQLTGQKENAEISYVSLIYENMHANIEGTYKELLKKHENEEKRQKRTLVGPHRDDILITSNAKDAKKYCSRGQQRTLSLSMKLTELQFISALKETAIIIDDVLTELDEIRKSEALKTLFNGKQLFFASTELPKEIPANSSVWKIEEGCVLSEANAADRKT